MQWPSSVDLLAAGDEGVDTPADLENLLTPLLLGIGRLLAAAVDEHRGERDQERDHEELGLPVLERLLGEFPDVAVGSEDLRDFVVGVRRCRKLEPPGDPGGDPDDEKERPRHDGQGVVAREAALRPGAGFPVTHGPIPRRVRIHARTNATSAAGSALAANGREGQRDCAVPPPGYWMRRGGV